jgi:hypothetical protein
MPRTPWVLAGVVLIGLLGFGAYQLQRFQQNLPSVPEGTSSPEETTLFHSGFRYVGEARQGRPEGYGRLFYANEQIRYEGQWKSGNPHGFGTSYFENGSIRFQGNWENGVSRFP